VFGRKDPGCRERAACRTRVHQTTAPEESEKASAGLAVGTDVATASGAALTPIGPEEMRRSRRVLHFS
ncbi:MAG TPA: hypothetical protein VFN64_10025, partial [Burkholderiaceae bacterium]|nr:hypothetical protein [Burkholderiaceae bacterium]